MAVALTRSTVTALEADLDARLGADSQKLTVSTARVVPSDTTQTTKGPEGPFVLHRYDLSERVTQNDGFVAVRASRDDVDWRAVSIAGISVSMVVLELGTIWPIR